MKRYFAAMALAMCLASGAANAAIITNGSFESGPSVPASPGFVTVPGGSLPDSAITGWTVTGGTVDYINGYWTGANSTAASVDLSGNGLGALSQMVSLIEGQAYELSFYLAANPDSSVYPRQVAVSMANLTGPSESNYFSSIFSYDPAGIPGGNNRPGLAWIKQTQSFVASQTGDALLSFTALNDGAFGPALDEVSIAAVPEPGTWALLFAGFVVVGSVLRRRRNDAVSFA